MRSFLLLTVLVGCGGGGDTIIDAHPMIDGGQPIDAAIDAPPPSADCTTYCTAMRTNCTGNNVQYPGADDNARTQSCLATCKSFPAGFAIDTSGNTRGCRIHFANAASNAADAASDCIAAGPLGDQIGTTTAACSGGDVCTSFCALEIQACGTLQQPLPGDPKDAAHSSIYQYQDLNDCLDSCHMFNLVSPYAPSSVGNSLACRLVQSIDAAIVVDPNALMDCANTSAVPNGPCTGGASP